MSGSPPRKPLHERSESASNSNASLARSTLRLVPTEPPALLGQTEEASSITRRTPLPTHPSHFLSPAKVRSKGALHYEFQHPYSAPPSSTSSGSIVSTPRTTPRTSDNVEPGTGALSPNKPKPVPKKRLQIHKDNKTFSLVAQDPSQPEEDEPHSPRTPSLSAKSSFDFLSAEQHNAKIQNSSSTSCTPEPSLSSPAAPSTPSSAAEQPIPADPIANSPWNYQLVGGIRKVAKTPDLKQKSRVTSESPLPSLPETSDAQDYPSHDLSAKPSFQSTQTATTTSENTNYIIYGDVSASASESALVPPSSSDSNYQVLGSPSPTGSVIHRPQSSDSETFESENENYELHGDPSPTPSFVNTSQPQNKYSQESLVVPPLKPRTRRSSDNLGLGYYKSRSRESLRTGSLTSISTVLSQREAARAIVTSGSLVNLLPLPTQAKAVVGSWADLLAVNPLRSHMNEHPHQWSSQLSTVLSVSEGGTDRGSRTWSDDNGRMSGSGFAPSSPSRHSRQMLSISSSMASPISPMEADLEPPRPAYAHNRRHNSTSSNVIEDVDEYGDGITDMQELRQKPSRSRISGFFSGASSDNGRTNTMRSTASSSRANSLLTNSIPTWAKLYYGSGERRYLGAPGSSTEGTDSRSSSFRSGSPNTDHFPLSIYSPRRRPRELNMRAELSDRRDSLVITPAHLGSDGQLINDPFSRKFRTWSMSSVWSPHLRMDRRATRQSIWEPPSVNWSTSTGWFGRRNLQVIMFIAGFIFPFAWMIGAILPLPVNPVRDMEERNDSSHSTSNLDSTNQRLNRYSRQFGSGDEARYESARWWRRLNRYMSAVGVLVIAAVVILVVVSLREGW